MSVSPCLQVVPDGFVADDGIVRLDGLLVEGGDNALDAAAQDETESKV